MHTFTDSLGQTGAVFKYIYAVNLNLGTAPRICRQESFCAWELQFAKEEFSSQLMQIRTFNV